MSGSRPGQKNKGHFQRGNQAAKGIKRVGRPVSPVPQLRREIAQAFLSAAAPRFESICTKLFDIAEGGDIKAIELVLNYALPKPLPQELNDPNDIADPELALTVENLKKMSSDELYRLMGRYILQKGGSAVAGTGNGQ